MQFKSIVFSLVATLALTQAGIVAERYGGCLQDMNPTFKQMDMDVNTIGTYITGGGKCTATTSSCLRETARWMIANNIKDLILAKAFYIELKSKNP